MPKTLRDTKKAATVVQEPPKVPSPPPEFVLGALIFTREQVSVFFNLLNEMTVKTIAGEFSYEDVEKGTALLDDIRNRWTYATGN